MGGSYKVPLVAQGPKLGDLLSRSSRGSWGLEGLELSSSLFLLTGLGGEPGVWCVRLQGLGVFSLLPSKDEPALQGNFEVIVD